MGRFWDGLEWYKDGGVGGFIPVLLFAMHEATG